MVWDARRIEPKETRKKRLHLITISARWHSRDLARRLVCVARVDTAVPRWPLVHQGTVLNGTVESLDLDQRVSLSTVQVQERLVSTLYRWLVQIFAWSKGARRSELKKWLVHACYRDLHGIDAELWREYERPASLQFELGEREIEASIWWWVDG